MKRGGAGVSRRTRGERAQTQTPNWWVLSSAGLPCARHRRWNLLARAFEFESHDGLDTMLPSTGNLGTNTWVTGLQKMTQRARTAFWGSPTLLTEPTFNEKTSPPQRGRTNIQWGGRGEKRNVGRSGERRSWPRRSSERRRRVVRHRRAGKHRGVQHRKRPTPRGPGGGVPPPGESWSSRRVWFDASDQLSVFVAFGKIAARCGQLVW